MSRATRSYLCSGLDLPSKPHDEQGELAALRAENERLRAALKPILARLEMPKNGRSLTQDVMIQASELVELQAALAGKEAEEPGPSLNLMTQGPLKMQKRSLPVAHRPTSTKKEQGNG